MASKMIAFAANGEQVPGYLARPDGDGPFPAVLVLQEWWGLNDHIKDVTNRMAGEGFVALAPDLYHGQVTEEPDEARKLAMALERPRVIKELQGAVDYLIALDEVSPKQVGVMGFCMGGGMAAGMAYLGQHVGAAVVFYGNVRDLADDEIATQVSAPLMGNFGGDDQGIPVDTVAAAEAKLQALGKTVDFHIYPGAPHAFFNDTRPHIYHEAAAKDAWQRTLGWLRRYLI